MSQQGFMKWTYTCLRALRLLRPHLPQQLWTSFPRAQEKNQNTQDSFQPVVQSQPLRPHITLTIMTALNFIKRQTSCVTPNRALTDTWCCYPYMGMIIASPSHSFVCCERPAALGRRSIRGYWLSRFTPTKPLFLEPTVLNVAGGKEDAEPTLGVSFR